METPFFGDWSDDFKRNAQRLTQLSRSSLHQLQLLCAAWIPAHRLTQADEGAFSRDRLWPFQLTFLSFLWQTLHAGSSCRDAVRSAAALAHSQNRPAPGDDTAAFCSARAKLPLERLDEIQADLIRDAENHIRQGDLWCDLRVRAVDGTCFSMPDTDANQKAFPQPSVQKPGCGFPIGKLLAFFCLSTAMITHWATGTWYQHELSLLPQLLDQLARGEVMLGDRGFGNFPVLAQCLKRGIHGVFRANTAKRIIDFRRGKSLGKHDRLVSWKKGLVCPRYLTRSEWDLLPDTIEVRVVKVQTRVKGFRTKSVILVTTLLDPVKYPPIELARLYLRRWRMELTFRDIKSTLQMDVLGCKTPEMVARELRMHLLSHNLLRRIGLEACLRHNASLERISFAGTLSAVLSFGDALLRTSTQKHRRALLDEMYRRIAEDLVPLRPGRREPRAVKRRPKPYPLLTCHRRKYQEIPHRNRYRR